MRNISKCTGHGSAAGDGVHVLGAGGWWHDIVEDAGVGGAATLPAERRRRCGGWVRTHLAVSPLKMMHLRALFALGFHGCRATLL